MKKNKGFSMIEIIIVIAIIVIIAGALVPFLIKYLKSSRETACIQGRETIRKEFDTEFLDAGLDPDNPADVDKIMNQVLAAHKFPAADTTNNTFTGTCKSGGTITYSISQGRVLTLECSEHPSH